LPELKKNIKEKYNKSEKIKKIKNYKNNTMKLREKYKLRTNHIA